MARVVVAEDEAIIRLDIVETLGDLGYEVVAAVAEGAAAIEAARALRPDVVLLDIAMPGLDGLAAAEAIATEAAVVMLTAFSQAEHVRRAAEAGAMGYLVKPFSPADLAPALEVAMSRHAELRALAGQAADLGERLEARKVLERAKAVLMESHGMTEPEAFAFIQRSAMDQRTTMRAVAEALLGHA